MARALINLPKTARRGEVIDIRTTIAHPMESGYRPGPDGQLLPRDIVTRFSCRYNGVLVFAADLYPAIASNPYIAFSTVATESGTLVFSWEGDHGFTQTESVNLAVT
jgi:sulfur-oxidizing protein SoxZ